MKVPITLVMWFINIICLCGIMATNNSRTQLSCNNMERTITHTFIHESVERCNDNTKNMWQESLIMPHTFTMVQILVDLIYDETDPHYLVRFPQSTSRSLSADHWKLPPSLCRTLILTSNSLFGEASGTALDKNSHQKAKISISDPVGDMSRAERTLGNASHRHIH